jgi:Tfp pilus assembly protein PilF
MKKAIEWINFHGVFLAFFLSIIGVAIAYFVYDIAIFQKFEEISAKQTEYRYNVQKMDFQNQMVLRHLKLGNIFLYDEHYKSAKAEFDKAAKLDKSNPDAQMGLFITGVYTAMEGDYFPDLIRDQIEFIEEEGLKAKKNGNKKEKIYKFEYIKPDAHANMLLGNLYAGLGENEKAKICFNKAIDSDKNAASAYFGLGVIYKRKNNLEKALENYEKAVKLSNWNVQYLNNLAECYGDKKQYDKAVKTYEFILTLDPNYLLSYCEIARIWMLKKDYEMAAAYLKKLSGLFDAPCEYEKGKIYAELEKNKKPWTFGDKNKITLYYISEKKYFALKSLSAILPLLNQKTEAENILKKADSIKIDIQDKNLIDDFIQTGEYWCLNR